MLLLDKYMSHRCWPVQFSSNAPKTYEAKSEHHPSLSSNSVPMPRYPGVPSGQSNVRANNH